MAGINGVGRVGIRNYVAPTTSLSSIIANGLVLNLDAGNALSYPGTGTTWTDLSGNGNNATLINGTSYSSVSGGALVFDGVNDYTEQIIPFSPSFTIFIWVYPISGNGIMLYGQSGSHPIMLLDYNTSGDLRIYVSNYYQTYSSALTLNRWNLISVVASESSSTREVFVNGISKGSGGYSPNSQVGLFRLGVQNFAGHGNCRIGQASVYNRALTSAEVLQNFNSTKSRFGFASYTTRTAAFATATGITDTTILNALNTFDTGLISNGLDTKMKALYPMVGGTANTHKFNFMDARDSDAAFRLVFNGGYVHSSTGVQPNGTNAFADTFLNASTVLTSANNHISYYSRTNPTPINSVEMGASDNWGYYSPAMRIRLDGFYGYSNKIMYVSGDTSSPNYTLSTNTDARGHFIGNILSTTNRKTYKNGSVSGSNTTSGANLLYNGNIYIFASNTNGGTFGYTNRECVFSSIGNGLTDTEASTFYSLTQALQTSLGRQV